MIQRQSHSIHGKLNMLVNIYIYKKYIDNYIIGLQLMTMKLLHQLKVIIPFYIKNKEINVKKILARKMVIQIPLSHRGGFHPCTQPPWQLPVFLSHVLNM